MTLAAALSRRLGNFPFWRGEMPLQPALRTAYAAEAAEGMATFLREAAGGQQA